MPEPERPDAPDAMDELRARVRATQEAAERIMREQRTPPQGWAASPPPPGAERASSELQALVGVLQSLLEMLPEDLRRQVNELMRQVLLVLRALIDWLVDRLDRGPPGNSPQVEDIPIS
jgi:hypothetical protein